VSSKLSKIWLVAVAGILAAFFLAALFLPQSFRLASICDVTDSLLLASGVAAFVPLALRSRGRTRLFWSLIILGLITKLCFTARYRISLPAISFSSSTSSR
jgi:hypothetical protein